MSVSAVNLKWYYSGGASNSDPALSIGGVKSSVELSATALHNLFDDVAGQEALDGYDEYRLLYFQNLDTDVNGLIDPVVWVTGQPAGADEIVELGVAAAGKNAEETAIANDHTAPVGVTFSAPTTKSTGIGLPSQPYVEDDYVGVWFHREVTAGANNISGEIFEWALEGETI